MVTEHEGTRNTMRCISKPTAESGTQQVFKHPLTSKLDYSLANGWDIQGAGSSSKMWLHRQQHYNSVDLRSLGSDFFEPEEPSCL